MKIKSKHDQLKERMDKVYTLHQLEDIAANKLEAEYREKFGRMFVSAATKRLLKLEARYKRDVAEALWDYYLTLKSMFDGLLVVPENAEKSS